MRERTLRDPAILALSPVPRPPRAPAVSGAAVVFWVLLGAIGLLVCYPLLIAGGRVAWEAWTAPSALLAGTAAAVLAKVLLNTCVVVVSGSVLALVAGAALACINERTDGGLGAAGELLPLAPMLVPPVAGVIGWAVLLDPRAGFVNGLLRGLLGAVGVPMRTGPFNIYSMPGLIAMTGLFLVPYVYLVVSAALRRLDPALEEASRVCGTPPMRTLLRVTLPAIAPALTAAFLIAVVAGIGLFSVPIVLGTAARVDVISTYIYRLLDAYPPNTVAALSLSAMLVAVLQVLLWAQRLVAPDGRHAATGGRGVRVARLSLGGWRIPARIVMIVYLASTSVLPVCGLALVSLQSFWTPAIRWASLSFENYRHVVLDDPTTSRALVTSLLLGAVVATAAMGVASFLTLRGGREGGRGRRAADALMSVPGTIPHTFVGVSFLLAFSMAPFRLYGSAIILLLAYLTMALPFAARAAAAAASGIGHELAEASRVAGASEARTLRRVLLPLALPGLAAGWVIVFIHTAGELTASAFLSGAGNPVIGRVLMDLWVFGNFPQVAALALVMTAVNTLCVGAMLAVSRRSFGAITG